MSLAGDGFQTRDDGYGDASLSQLFYKMEILAIVEKHLCHDIIGTSLNLFLQMLDVGNRQVLE